MERINLGELEHTVHRWFVRGRRGDLDHAVIGIGQLDDERWFVAKVERNTNMAWLAASERHACDTVQRWIDRRGGNDLWPEMRPQLRE